MTKNQNRLIFAAILIVVVGLYVARVHSPQARRLAAVREKIARRDIECQENAAKADAIPVMVCEVDRLKKEFKDFDRRLPKQKELAEFLREISNTGESHRLANQVIRPGNPSIGPLYNRMPIIMDFSCTFPDLVGFLQKMNEMTRLTRVERIRMSPVASHSENLDIRMQVNIYFTKS